MNIVDLTLTLSNGFMSFPGHPKVKIDEVSTFKNSKHKYISPCEGFESRLISFSDHSGTHIDAPLHFIRDGSDSANINLKDTINKCLVIDVSNKNINDEISYEMLESNCNEDLLKNVTSIIIKSRKGSWGDQDFFNEPAYNISAAEWFAEKNIKLVGIDLPNIDTNSNMKRDVHLALLSKNILIVENLVNLDLLPNNEVFMFYAAPLKIENATGSPVRAFAVIEETENVRTL